MPLFLLGLVFAIGLFIFYLVSTGGNGDDSNRSKYNGTAEKNAKKSAGASSEKKGNVLYFPTDIEKARQEQRKNK